MAQSESEKTAGTLSQKAYTIIREEILSGDLPHGQPLRLEFLKDRYGLSFSPIREALSQLHAEKLVAASSQRGYRVAPLLRTEMWDAINTRIFLDSEALRQSMKHGDDEWEARVISSFHALGKARQRLVEDNSRVDMPLIEERHRTFHTTLLSATPSRWLRDLCEALYVQTERYRRPALSVVFPETTSDGPDAEHRQMVEAVLSRDVELGVDLLNRHLTATGKFIETALKEFDEVE